MNICWDVCLFDVLSVTPSIYCIKTRCMDMRWYAFAHGLSAQGFSGAGVPKIAPPRSILVVSLALLPSIYIQETRPREAAKRFFFFRIQAYSWRVWWVYQGVLFIFVIYCFDVCLFLLLPLLLKWKHATRIHANIYGYRGFWRHVWRKLL